MNAIRVAGAFLIILTAGCAPAARYNSDCSWPSAGHTSMVLDLGRATDRRHLAGDALVAEDLAIRHADRRNGPKSGRFRDRESYHAARDQCMAALFEIVADLHRVEPKQVRAAVTYRSGLFDAAVFISFVVLYWLVARKVATRVTTTFSDDIVVLSIAVLFASVGLAVVGSLFGDVWAGVAETLRVGNGHVSYRVNRIPWRHYPAEIVTGCVVFFWIIAAHQAYVFRSTRHGNIESPRHAA